MHKVIREELGAPSAQPDDIVFNRAYDPAIDRGLSKDCIARAPSEPAASSVPPQETPGLNGILWRCYHALKAVEWAYDDDITLMDGCPYCGCSRKHDDDCMVGNALKAMDEFVWASSVPVEQTKDKR